MFILASAPTVISAQIGFLKTIFPAVEQEMIYWSCCSRQPRSARRYRGDKVCLFSLVFDSRHVNTKEYWCPKRTSSIQYDYKNGELMHDCSPKHLRMGTARLKQDNETEEESKKMRMNVERSTADTKKRSHVQSLCRVVTSVTHDSPSVSPDKKVRREAWVWKEVKRARKKVATAYHYLIKIQY